MRVGLVADTHDFYDPQLDRVLAGCDLIVHAGDVAREPVLSALRRLAPVRAVRGNNDLGPFGESLPETAVVELDGVRALVIHDVGARGRPAPAARRAIVAAAPDLVVHGHSHRPGHALVDGVLFLNPGSAGRRRFSLPRSAAVLEVSGRSVRVDWLDLVARPARPLGAALSLALPAAPALRH